MYKELPLTIKEFLSQEGITYQERGAEIVTKCLFNVCDADSKSNEFHLYFNTETSQYHCKKCDESGNLYTLAKFLKVKLPHATKSRKSISTKDFKPSLVDECHNNLPDSIRKSFHELGITDEIISKMKIGYGIFYGSGYITYPIQDSNGHYIGLKLRQDPTQGDKKITFPKGIHAQLFGNDLKGGTNG